MMSLIIFLVNMKLYFVSFAKIYMYNFSFEQSTRKCRWKCYNGQAKFLDELKRRQVIARKKGYGSDYVNLFVKHHKNKIREFAR